MMASTSRDNTFFIVGLVAGMIACAALFSAEILTGYAAKAAVEKCESVIPRNQRCKPLISAKPINRP